METGTTAATTANHSLLSAGAAKTFIAAHPIGVAVVGGIVIGAATYYLMKKIFGGKKEEATAA